jgi:hypothetical protein
MNPTQRVLTAQMEALQLVEAIHENDIQNFKARITSRTQRPRT